MTESDALARLSRVAHQPEQPPPHFRDRLLDELLGELIAEQAPRTADSDADPDTEQLTMEVIMLDPTRNEPTTRRRTWLMATAAAIAAVALIGALIIAGSRNDDEPVPADQPTSGSVVITTEWVNGDTDYSATGTFEVTEGAVILGCSSGTLTDLGLTQVGTSFTLEREWACGSGDNDGTFSTTFSLTGQALLEPPDEVSWEVTAASGDFAGIRGEGEMILEVDDGGTPDSRDDTGNETITGTFRYDS